MRFDMDNLNPGTWFYFNDDDKEAGGVCVRPLTEDAIESIKEQTVKKKISFVRGRKIVDEIVDRKKDRELTVDFCIPEWSVLDKAGVFIPCTKENKSKLVRSSPKFSAFFANCLSAVMELEEYEEEAAEKN